MDAEQLLRDVPLFQGLTRRELREVLNAAKEVEFAPGTIEAYQKAIELDPNGTYGQQAKAGLEQLQQMAPGIDLKVNVRKKKS